MKFFKFFLTCSFCPMMCIVSEGKNIFLDISYEITVIFLLKICKLCVVAASPHGKPFFFCKTCVFFDKYVMLRIFIALHIPQFNQHGTSHQNLLYCVIILVVKSSAYNTSYVAWYSKVTELKLVYDSD